MHRNRSILWGLLLIGIGAILLLRSTGAISKDVEIWPLILIAIGAWLLIERLAFGGHFGGGFVWPLVLIAVGGVFFLRDVGAIGEDATVWPAILIAIGLGIVLSAVPGRRASQPVRESVPLDGATAARIVMKHGAGRLTVRSQVDPALLLDGTFSTALDKQVRRTGDELQVTLGHRSGAWFPWNWGPGGPLDWSVGIARTVPIRLLQIDAGANKADLDLSDLTVEELRVSTGASDTTITVPAHGRTRAWVKAGAASVRVQVPQRTAARIVVRGGLASSKVDQSRFPPYVGGYQSPDFETAEDRVELEVDAGAANVEVQ